MRYRIVAIGKLKRGFLRAGCEHYLSRLELYGKVEVLELKEGKGAPEQGVPQESRALLGAASGHVVALDERGKALTSAQLAQTLSALESGSVSQLSVLIGGANGHSETLRAQVNEVWSLSSLTLPHELARLVLLEQLYRAESIRAGHPYHRA